MAEPYALTVEQQYGYRQPAPRPALLMPVTRANHSSTGAEGDSALRTTSPAMRTTEVRNLTVADGGGTSQVSDMTATAMSDENARLLQQVEALQAQINLNGASVVAEPEITHVKHHVQLEVKKGLFHKVKFITSDADLDDIVSPTSVANFIFRSMNVPNERKSTFWKRYRNIVFRALVDQRNNVTAKIKKEWFGKFLLNCICIVFGYILLMILFVVFTTTSITCRRYITRVE